MINNLTVEDKIKDLEKIKEYAYDSLVYRYIRAREMMMHYEIEVFNADPKSAKLWANRDIQKFNQILDEAIGEHN